MAFWSSQTLKGQLANLVNPADETAIDCNAIQLKIGPEIYVTPELEDVNKTTKRLLAPSEPFQIPPGQFAFLLTEEIVTVPPTTMALISMKATFKMKGLVNVSGFHVDPGWVGRLVFAVFNAGPAPIHLQRGLALFLIWYADLDEESEKRKTTPGSMTISPAIINNLTGGTDSLYALDERLRKAIDKLESEDKDLSNRIHALNNAQAKMTVTLTALLTIALGLGVYAFRDSLPNIGRGIVRPAPTLSPATQPPVSQSPTNHPASAAHPQ
jgi:dCTP deaminase